MREAATIALRELMEIASLTASRSTLSPKPFDACVVSWKHFVLATEKVKPSVSASVREMRFSFSLRSRVSVLRGVFHFPVLQILTRQMFGFCVLLLI